MMSHRISETPFPGLTLAFDVDETLWETRSEFQKIGFYRTKSHGVLLLMDDSVMLTERDEYVYHEMVSHMPLASHPDPKEVLIIGGGDLGTVRECLRHPELEQVHLCEIDQAVVEGSRRYFPWAESAATDPRTMVAIADGFEWIQRPESAGRYDVVVVDSSEAASEDVLPEALALFRAPFFAQLRNVLRPGGFVCGQCESAFYHESFIVDLARELRAAFHHVRFFTATVPTYPGGLWTFYLASDTVPIPEAPVRPFSPSGLQYYTPTLHRAAFALPARLERFLQSES